MAEFQLKTFKWIILLDQIFIIEKICKDSIFIRTLGVEQTATYKNKLTKNELIRNAKEIDYSPIGHFQLSTRKLRLRASNEQLHEVDVHLKKT